MTEWFTSPANTAIACLMVIVLAAFTIREIGRRDKDNTPKRLRPEDIRQRLKKKAAASGNDTDSGKCREKHSTYNIAGGGENVNLL
ncbi:MAG: hypothetical protein ACLSS9_02945 [Acutalibacteraceae bacterium]